uniref:Uncharacterized protein n=1 Tax=Rhizophora mucronata TaxID=61149 RepID=A0A2P2Q070_RHIMU
MPRLSKHRKQSQNDWVQRYFYHWQCIKTTGHCGAVLEPEVYPYPKGHQDRTSEAKSKTKIGI